MESCRVSQCQRRPRRPEEPGCNRVLASVLPYVNASAGAFSPRAEAALENLCIDFVL